MIGDAYTEDELKALFNVKQRAALVRKLDKARIPYMVGGGDTIVTTQTAMNAALVGMDQKPEVITDV